MPVFGHGLCVPLLPVFGYQVYSDPMPVFGYGGTRTPVARFRVWACPFSGMLVICLPVFGYATISSRGVHICQKECPLRSNQAPLGPV